MLHSRMKNSWQNFSQPIQKIHRLGGSSTNIVHLRCFCKSSPSPWTHLRDMDLCNDLVKPSVEATATLDNDSALQASNMTHTLIETHHRRCTRNNTAPAQNHPLVPQAMHTQDWLIWCSFVTYKCAEEVGVLVEIDLPFLLDFFAWCIQTTENPSTNETSSSYHLNREKKLWNHVRCTVLWRLSDTKSGLLPKTSTKHSQLECFSWQLAPTTFWCVPVGTALVRRYYISKNLWQNFSLWMTTAQHYRRQVFNGLTSYSSLTEQRGFLHKKFDQNWLWRLQKIQRLEVRAARSFTWDASVFFSLLQGLPCSAVPKLKHAWNLYTTIEI
jgi:hypothetical protein